MISFFPDVNTNADKQASPIACKGESEEDIKT